jgi:nucleotide-binding universal stress UspA family protein
MFPIRHILFPTDFSDRTVGITGYVRSLALKYDAQVSLLHVAEDLFMVPSGTGLLPVPIELPPDQIKQLEQSLDNFAAKELGGLNVKRSVSKGDVASTIVDYAQTENVDLIAMPTHGHGRFRRFLLGSVTAKVLHDASRPILTGAHLETPVPADGKTFHRILCSVGLQPHSKNTLAYAARLACDFEAKLSVVHAMEILDARLALNFGADWEADLVEAGKAQLHGLMNEAGATGDVYVKLGNPMEVICQLAKSIECDLMVVGRSTEHGALHGDAYDLIRESPCPVISV